MQSSPFGDGIMLPPPKILKAALQVLFVAGYTTRNWTLAAATSQKQINALWEALHPVPDLLTRWHDDEMCLSELKMYFREYDEAWDAPKLEVIFDQTFVGLSGS